METGFLNFHDEEHFSTMTFDNGAMLDDSDGSVLDVGSPLHFSGSYKPDPWGSCEEELNGDIATLPGPLAGSNRSKEDFQRMLNDWDQIGYTQCVDDNIYDMIEPVSEICGLEIFDESSFDGDNIGSNKRLDTTQTSRSKSKRLVGRDLSLGHFIKEEEDEADQLMLLESVRDSDPIQSLDDEFRIDIDDEDDIDVETVNEQIPVLEAVDMSSLLEQFEASETVNESTKAAPADKETAALDTKLVALASKRVKPALAIKPSLSMSHQSIIDALPKEVVERIKASGRKKAIPVIPAMPSRRPGKAATRMQDAGAALSRNKLLKIVSSGPVAGESIQLDHDYCTGAAESAAPRSFYHSDATEYAREKPAVQPSDAKPAAKRDSDSRKDSGLESGDSSDDNDKSYASSPASPAVGLPGDRIVKINGKDINLGSIMQNVNNALVNAASKAPQPGKDKQMVSVLKRSSVAEEKPPVLKVDAVNVCVKEEDVKLSSVASCGLTNADDGHGDSVAKTDPVVKVEQDNLASVVEKKSEPKKRKLNLSEYRSRVKVLDRPRDSADSSRASSPLGCETPTLEEAKQIFEQATQMLINAKGRIDEESFAQIRKTLEKQSAIRMPTHMLPQQEELRPKKEVTANSPKDSCLVLDSKPVKVIASLPQLEPSLKNTQELRVQPKEEPPIKMEQDTPILRNESVVVLEETSQVAKKAASVPVVSEHFIKTFVPVVEPVAKTVASDVKVKEDQVFEKTVVVSEEIANVDTSISKVKETEAKIVIQDTSVDQVQDISVDQVQPMETEPVTAANEERRTLLKDLEEGKSRDRSRRHYRSRRAESTSSSSSASRSHSPRRGSTSVRSVRSRSSSSRASSRSSVRSKPRSWQRDRRSSRYDSRRNNSSRSHTSRSSCRSYSGRVSPGPEFRVTEREKERQVQERRVVYVGRLDETMTKSELRARFESYGPIVDISVHFREHGDNYGFVTFAYKVDAYAAVEQGKKDPTLGQYDLSFGGRRAFCKTRYADLDGNKMDDDYGYSSYRPFASRSRHATTGTNFDDLLREALKSKVVKSKP